MKHGSDTKSWITGKTPKVDECPRDGDMLGLKKTDRYWLVHKNYFRTETLLGKMRLKLPVLKSGMPIRTGITKSMGKHREKS